MNLEVLQQICKYWVFLLILYYKAACVCTGLIDLVICAAAEKNITVWEGILYQNIIF